MKFSISRLPKALAKIGSSRSGFYKGVSEGTQPEPISLGGRAKGWLDHELEAVTRARAAGLSDPEIKQLVRELKNSRAATYEEILAQARLGLTRPTFGADMEVGRQ
jgi:prophage regulatory protein